MARPFRSVTEVFDKHGLIVASLLCATEMASWLSIGNWLRYAPREQPFRQLAFDLDQDKVKAWWQDVVFILLLAFTPLALMAGRHGPAWGQFGGAFPSAYLIFDALIYYVRVLWFDDLQPNISHSRRDVWSHRRILFQAVAHYAQSIVLFTSIYRQLPCLASQTDQQLLERSFSAATLLSAGDPFTAVTGVQVSISIFYLGILIATMASIAYRRREAA